MVVGHIALLFRAISMGKTIVPIVGLAEVATHPAHAGQGIASALLKRAIAHSRGSLANFIVLFGDHPIYAKHGFQTMKNPLRYVAMDGSQTYDVVTRIEDALMIVPLKDVVWDPEAKVDLMGHLF
jgi:predicted N-acetyltransferase YhbS